MSKHIHISKLNSYLKNKIYNLLQLNGCDNETIDLLFAKGNISDLSDIIDLEEVFVWISNYYTVVKIIQL